MDLTKQGTDLGRAVLAAALLAAFGAASADDADDLARLTQLTSEVSIGAAAASGSGASRTLFGQYNGLRARDFNLLLDFDFTRRDDQTGTWTLIRARNLGLDTPELGFTLNRQGDWKVSASLDEIVKHDPRTINTAMVGAGTTAPTVVLLGAPGTGQDVNLELKRRRLGLNIDKWITPALQVQLSFKNEDKTGAVTWGRGFACASAAAPGCAAGTAGTTGYALLLLPQPVDSRTVQIEAKLNYHTEALFLSGGYYGSFYIDHHGALTPNVPATLDNGVGVAHPLSAGLQAILGLPMALWPSNQAHQLYLDGTYAFTPKVRSTFNLSYQRATQNQDFAAMGLAGAPAGVSNLGALVNTTLAQFGLTARPIAKLSLNANLRYDNRDDRTPLQLYNIEGPLASQFTNDRSSHRKLAGKLEGTYQLPANLRGTLGIDYESINRDLPVSTTKVAGLTALRQKTAETSYRAELRRTFSDNFAGSLGVVHVSRTGSDWYNLSGAGFTYGQIVSSDQLATLASAGLPSYLLDRTRDKVRASAQFTPSERVSLQILVEDGTDHYHAPTYTGMQNAAARLYSLDGSWAISSKWKLSGYITRSDQTMQVNMPSLSSYQMAMRDLNDTIGIGLTGRLSERLDLGASLAYINDRNRYGETLGPTAAAANVAFLGASGGLPDVTFREMRLGVYGKYAFDKNSALRVDLLRQNDRLNEWTWSWAGVPFAYADNTTVTLNPNQSVTVFTLRYIYTFR